MDNDILLSKMESLVLTTRLADFPEFARHISTKLNLCG